MFMRGLACFLVLNLQDEVVPSISSSVVLCSFVLLVYIVVLAVVVYLCPSSVRVVATFSSTMREIKSRNRGFGTNSLDSFREFIIKKIRDGHIYIYIYIYIYIQGYS
jgi:hypothetical protein